ncbi:putative transmembrane ascorbate ferrireductase 4 [Bidens hawaiensis]|uniref:putative transmembrane ascorbate ferrireductase 4 n=1 Tax=Bidens hawaiensis TaxID=980011 RepID=UPI0040497201
MATANSLLLLARVSATVVAILVLTWALYFTTSFLPHTHTALSHKDLIYSVLHPLLMVIGFILISGEAILVHRWFKKEEEMGAFVATRGGIGEWDIWDLDKVSRDTRGCGQFLQLAFLDGSSFVSLFGAQWLMGFLSFWHRGEVRMSRMRFLPWHVFLGLYTCNNS